MDHHEDQIPREILESEYKRSLPPRPPRPDFMGIPPIPDDIFDVIVKYLPWLVLAGAITNGFEAAGVMITISQVNEFSSSLASKLGTFLSLSASVVGVLAFFWLSDKRRLGWNALAIALFLQILSGLVISGGASILSGMLGVAFMAYFLLQIREYYNE